MRNATKIISLLAEIVVFALAGGVRAEGFVVSAAASTIGPVGNSFVSHYHKGRYGFSLCLARDKENRIVPSPAISYSTFEIDYGHGGLVRSGFLRFLAGAEAKLPVLRDYWIVPQTRIGYCIFRSALTGNGQARQRWQQNGICLFSAMDLRRKLFRRISSGASLQYTVDYLEKGDYEDSNYNRLVQNLQFGIVTTIRL